VRVGVREWMIEVTAVCAPPIALATEP